MMRGAILLLVILTIAGCGPEKQSSLDGAKRPAAAANELRGATADIVKSTDTIDGEARRVAPPDAGERILGESARIRDRTRDIDRTADDLDVTDAAVAGMEAKLADRQREITDLEKKIMALERELEDARSAAQRAADRLVYIGAAVAIGGGVFLSFIGMWRIGVPLALSGGVLLGIWRFLDRWQWLIDIGIMVTIGAAVLAIAWQLWQHRHAFMQVVGELLSVENMLDDDAKAQAQKMIEDHQTQTTKGLFDDAKRRLPV